MASTFFATQPANDTSAVHSTQVYREEAVRIVQVFYNKGLPALDACRYLIARAAVCWRRFEGDYRDDITAVVVYLDILLGELTAEALVPVLEGAEAEGGVASPEQ